MRHRVLPLFYAVSAYEVHGLTPRGVVVREDTVVCPAPPDNSPKVLCDGLRMPYALQVYCLDQREVVTFREHGRPSVVFPGSARAGAGIPNAVAVHDNTKQREVVACVDRHLASRSLREMLPVARGSPAVRTDCCGHSHCHCDLR